MLLLSLEKPRLGAGVQPAEGDEGARPASRESRPGTHPKAWSVPTMSVPCRCVRLERLAGLH